MEQKNQEPKNIEKRIKYLFVVFIAIMIIVLSFSIFSFVRSFNSSDEETTRNEIEETNPFAEENEKQKVVFNDAKTEYPKENTDQLYTYLIGLASEKKYDELINKVGELKENYNFTKDYNLKIVHVYMDAVVLNHLAQTSVTDDEISLYTGIDDLAMKCIGLFRLTNEAKAMSTVVNSSICPYGDKSVVFQDYEQISLTQESTDEYILNMQKSLNTQGYFLNENKDMIYKDVYICYLKVDETPINIYLVKRLDGKWILYGITYRNSETYNEYWGIMKEYYSINNYGENQ